MIPCDEIKKAFNHREARALSALKNLRIAFKDVIASPSAENEDALLDYRQKEDAIFRYIARAHDLADLQTAACSPSSSADDYYALGEAYSSGVLIEPNLPHAIYWLTKAVEANHISAHLSLIDIYEDAGNEDMADFWLKIYEENLSTDRPVLDFNMSI